MPRLTGPNTRQKKNAAQVAEERLRCYELRLAGATIRMIAKQTGLAIGTVDARIQAEIQARVEPLADEVRKMQLDRLDEWLMHLNRQIRAGTAVARNIEIALRVEERRAKLLGVDKPEKFEVTTGESDLDAALRDLEEQMRRRAERDQTPVPSE